MGGLGTALAEITLVLFTTLAPSGALAFALAGLPIVAGKADEAARIRINRILCIPLVVALLGLVASATHLGNPGNALFVFAGVGRSPLSNEVFAAVAFLALAGLYWLYGFAEHPRLGLQRVWLAATGLAALAFVAFVAVAYDVPTIATWSAPTVPANLALTAAVGGPVLAAGCLELAGYAPVRGRLGSALLALAACALVANLAVMGVQGALWGDMANEFAAATELVGGYGAFVVGYAVLAAGGIALAWQGLRRGGRQAAWMLAGSALVLVGIFLTRFAFYMGHLTV